MPRSFQITQSQSLLIVKILVKKKCHTFVILHPVFNLLSFLKAFCRVQSFNWDGCMLSQSLHCIIFRMRSVNGLKGLEREMVFGSILPFCIESKVLKKFHVGPFLLAIFSMLCLFTSSPCTHRFLPRVQRSICVPQTTLNLCILLILLNTSRVFSEYPERMKNTQK